MPRGRKNPRKPARRFHKVADTMSTRKPPGQCPSKSPRPPRDQPLAMSGGAGSKGSSQLPGGHEPNFRRPAVKGRISLPKPLLVDVVLHAVAVQQHCFVEFGAA